MVGMALPAPISAFAGLRSPPEIIVRAIRWCVRTGRSSRDIEELRAERGIDVDDNAVSEPLEHELHEAYDSALFNDTTVADQQRDEGLAVHHDDFVGNRPSRLGRPVARPVDLVDLHAAARDTFESGLELRGRLAVEHDLVVEDLQRHKGDVVRPRAVPINDSSRYQARRRLSP